MSSYFLFFFSLPSHVCSASPEPMRSIAVKSCAIRKIDQRPFCISPARKTLFSTGILKKRNHACTVCDTAPKRRTGWAPMLCETLRSCFSSFFGREKTAPRAGSRTRSPLSYSAAPATTTTTCFRNISPLRHANAATSGAVLCRSR